MTTGARSHDARGSFIAAERERPVRGRLAAATRGRRGAGHHPMTRRRGQQAELPLPPASDTLAVLDQLAVHQYETRARAGRALKLSHVALRDVLSMLESYARYPDLVARSIADDLHRRIRRELRLDDQKRFPPLPRRAA